jgi:hypothetical protein
MSSVADEAIQQKIVIKELHLKKTLVKFFAFRKALLATSPDSNVSARVQRAVFVSEIPMLSKCC